MAKGPTKIVSLTTRIERELTVPAETITALGQQEMPRATVEVRWAAAPTVAAEVEAAMVDAMAMRSRGEDMEDQTMTVEAETVGVIIGEKGMAEVTGGMIVGRVEEEVEVEGGKEEEVEGMEAPHGQAQTTTQLLPSRVEVGATAVASAVVEAARMLPPSLIGVTEAGLEAQMCPRIVLCSQWGEDSTRPLQSHPLAIHCPLSPSEQALREATQAPVETDLMLTTRTQ